MAFLSPGSCHRFLIFCWVAGKPRLSQSKIMPCSLPASSEGWGLTYIFQWTWVISGSLDVTSSYTCIGGTHVYTRLCCLVQFWALEGRRGASGFASTWFFQAEIAKGEALYSFLWLSISCYTLTCIHCNMQISPQEPSSNVCSDFPWFPVPESKKEHISTVAGECHKAGSRLATVVIPSIIMW